jgi:hypothetical protein
MNPARGIPIKTSLEFIEGNVNRYPSPAATGNNPFGGKKS